MDVTRRKFCRVSFLGALGLIFMPRKALASSGDETRLSGRCIVEVLRCQCFSDLQGRYLDDPEVGPCSHFHVGDKIEITPDNLQALKNSGRICRQAWHTLEPYIMAALATGSTSECAPAQNISQAIVSCPDGTRPVIFKVTAA